MSDNSNPNQQNSNWTSLNVTNPSMSPDPNRRPSGEYEDLGTDLENRRSFTRQNEASDILAQAGYDVDMGAPEFQSPYNPTKRVDLIIEGNYFDVYSPDTGTSAYDIWDRVAQKVGSGQTRRVVLNLADSDASIHTLIHYFTTHPTSLIDGLEEIIIIFSNRNIVHIGF
ncbi:MAG: hypothetical protein WBC91_03215 [Phototrophicaceae bacterium]